MNRKIFGVLAAAVVLAPGLALGGTLYAQERGDAPMGGMMDMMAMMKDCPMHQAMAERPGRVLEHREELVLSEDQVARLEALEARTKEMRKPMMERMRALHEEIAAASSDDGFDEAALRAAFDRMGDLHTEMGVAMLRTRHDVRAVLTPEQREKLSELGGGMMGMHGMMKMMGGMGGMNMDDCPMMRGKKQDAGKAGSHHGSQHQRS